MQTQAEIRVFKVWANSQFTYLDRVEADGEPLLKADISSIAYYVYDEKAKTTVDSGTINKNVAISDTLQTTYDWSADLEGHNFIHVFDSYTAGKTYKYKVVFTLATGQSRLVVFRCVCVDPDL